MRLTNRKQELEMILTKNKEELDMRLNRLSLNKERIFKWTIIGQIGFVLEKAISQFVLGDPSYNITDYYHSNPRFKVKVDLTQNEQQKLTDLQNEVLKLTGQHFHIVFQKIIEIKSETARMGQGELAKLTKNDLIDKIDEVAEDSDNTQFKLLLDVLVMLKQNSMFPLKE